MPTTIRSFEPRDAAGLLAVEQAVWDESGLDAGQVAALAAQPAHGVWVAAAGERIAGFAWCFLSRTHERGPTWELDVLAVHPDFRRQGLGRALVAAAYAGGQARGAAQTRAIVATPNRASYRAFTGAGFNANPRPRDLFVQHLAGLERPALPVEASERPPGVSSYLVRPDRPAEPPTAALRAELHAGQAIPYLEALPVYTLLYSGLWLEAWRCPDAGLPALLVEAARLARDSGLADVTCLLHPEHAPAGRWLRAAGFQVENTYYVLAKAYMHE